MREAIEKASRKLRRSTQLLHDRRLIWRVITKHLVEEELREFIAQTTASDFPFRFSIDFDKTPNEETIQLSAGKIKTGVVDRKYDPGFANSSFYDTHVIEAGGDFVVSQGITGLVTIIVYPRSSDRITPTQKVLLLCSPLDPGLISRKVVRKVLSAYLLILQDSSAVGTEDALTLVEQLKLVWIYFQEVQNKDEFWRSVLYLKSEWFKACIAGLFGFVGGYLAGLLTK